MNMGKKQTEIFSVFGVCEMAAADMLIKRYGLHRIEPTDIPESAAVNSTGLRAAFAVVVPHEYVREFHQLCREMRA
jgi:hypothetical protein